MAIPADQLSKTLKTDTLGLPDVSKMRKSSDVLTARQELLPRVAKSAADVKKAELDIESDVLGAKARAAEDFAKTQRAETEKYEAAMKATPLPEFKMTEDTAMTMGSLFSLTATLGIMLGASGKESSNRALAAMTGMLQGWQAGRKDLYEREKQKYEKEFARVQAIHTDLRRTFDDYMKLAATDKEAAALKAEELVRKAGSGSIIAAYMEKGQLDAINQLLNGAEAQLKHKEDLANRLATATARGTGRASPSGAGGAVQFRYNAAMAGATNSAIRNVDNITSLPIKTAPPVVGSWLSDPSHSITDGVLKYMAQTETAEDARLFQQYNAALTRELGVIAGQGRPGGAGEGMMKELSRMAPQAGDKKINTYAYLALVRQFFDVAVEDLKVIGGTPEQIAAAEKNRDFAHQLIPFEVSDINNMVRAGGEKLTDKKVTDILTKSGSYSDFQNLLEEKSAEDEAAIPLPAPKAMPTGDRLKAYADANFGGDEKKAKAYLESLGYK